MLNSYSQYGVDYMNQNKLMWGIVKSKYYNAFFLLTLNYKEETYTIQSIDLVYYI